VDGAAVAGLWALLKLGWPREGRTATDRESKEKRESAGAGALDVADGCGLEAVSPCSARGDAGAEGEEKWGTMEVGLRGTMRWGQQPSLLACFFLVSAGEQKGEGEAVKICGLGERSGCSGFSLGRGEVVGGVSEGDSCVWAVG